MLKSIKLNPKLIPEMILEIRERYLKKMEQNLTFAANHSIATCMPSRDPNRISEYHKIMIAERGKFIEKYPVLNPPPP